MSRDGYQIRYRPAGMPAVREDGRKETRAWIIDVSGFRKAELLPAAQAVWDSMDAVGHIMLSERPE